MSKLKRAIEKNDLKKVHHILQSKKRSRAKLNEYLSYAMDEDAPIEIFILLILSGANAIDTKMYEPEEYPLITKVLTALPIFASLRQKQQVTLEKLVQLVELIEESEPIDVPPPTEATCCTFTVEQLQAVKPLTCVKGYFSDVITSGKIESLLWLLRRYPNKVKPYHVQYAAELGYVSMLEALIMATGFTMYADFWYIRNTARRVHSARLQVIKAVMLVHKLTLPAEIRNKIAEYIWSSRFDFATWNSERNWSSQRMHAREILSE
jgi:hypothetical protein